MSDQSSTSSESQEAAIRTSVVHVQALSRLRSLSGRSNFFAPAGFDWIRNDSNALAVPEASESTSTNSNTSTGSQSSSTSTASNRYVRTVLVLNSKCLYYEAQNWRREVLLEDLLGVEISSNPPTNNVNACELNVHYYPVYSKSGKHPSRKRLLMSVQFCSEATREANVETAKEWKHLILLETERVVRREFCCADEITYNGEEFHQRKFLIFVNPVGGQGKAVIQFEKIVRPLFDLAEIKYDVIFTERRNHGRDVIKTYDLSSVDGIVCASGDGVLYEIVNGIMEREDWETAIKTPVGMLPLGSGNALCASSLHESGEEYSLLNAAFMIIRGRPIPLNVSTLQIPGGHKCYLCLLASWGIVADIDIESEKLRKLGQPRFIVGAISCIAKNRKYPGKLSYLPIEEDEATDQSTSDPFKTQQSSDHTLSSEQDLNQASLEPVGGSKNNVPDAETTVDTAGDAAPTAESVCQASVESASTVPTQYAEAVPSTSLADLIMTKCSNGPVAELLPSFSSPVPSNWKTLNHDFVTAAVMLVPHMGRDMFGDPNLSIGTSGFSIVILDGTMTRMDMVTMFTQSDTGGHVALRSCSVISAKAIRLEPLTPQGRITIDGEVIPYGPIQCQLHPRLARVMSRKRRERTLV